MATAQIKAVITAQDNASAVVQGFSNNVGGASNKVQAFGAQMSNSFAQFAAIAVAAGVATQQLVGVINSSVAAANRSQAAMVGLNSVAKAFGVNAEEATKAAQDLAEDGLMTVAEAAAGLKNLLAAGFSLPQATRLIDRFRDSAAFARQGSLEFGQAVVSATEGIKNGNSILVDNAGVTKNLSVILSEAGFSAQDLMRATTDASVRMAIFNGIIKETNPQVGDAARLSQLYAGQQAKLNTEVTKLQQSIGTALQPALLKLLEAITPLIERFAAFAEKNPELTANILLGVTAFTALIAVIGTLGLALPPLITGLGFLSGAFGLATGAAVALGASIAAPFVIVIAGVAGIWAAYNAVKSLDDAYKGLAESQRVGKEVDDKFWQSIKNLPPEERARRSHQFNQSMQGKARGGSVMDGVPYLVGEKGPELFVPSNNGRIIPNNQTSTGGQTIVNVTANVGVYAGTELEKRKLAKELFESLKDVAGSKNMSVSQMLGG